MSNCRTRSPSSNSVARLSPFVRHHVNMLGRYSFQLPELPGGLRPCGIRTPTTTGKSIRLRARWC
ncbi:MULTISPECIES: hypothetical protein [unclassified Streptomyces]|uniref:hypothetical protein n=1 Tax=unclassified Streptomyces TaxID=2593676 RepID=UPI00225868BD|nr:MULTISPECIES: hypothetical protein [unclassified Streptomyces]MCX4649373.1 transposase [Streptomyces sp. NBC_01446]MCX5321428.1 transposase [Streptomyces sp. NBC_00120]